MIFISFRITSKKKNSHEINLYHTLLKLNISLIFVDFQRKTKDFMYNMKKNFFLNNELIE